MTSICPEPIAVPNCAEGETLAYARGGGVRSKPSEKIGTDDFRALELTIGSRLAVCG